jgi:hypothetical protein
MEKIQIEIWQVSDVRVFGKKLNRSKMKKR